MNHNVVNKFSMQPCSLFCASLCHRSLFGSAFLYGKAHRHDGVKYKLIGIVNICLVDSVYIHTSSKFPAKLRLLLTLHLVSVHPDTGNQHIVTTYGHLRYVYKLSAHQLFETVLVHCAELLHSVMVCIDPYWMKQSGGLEELVRNIDDSTKNHR